MSGYCRSAIGMMSDIVAAVVLVLQEAGFSDGRRGDVAAVTDGLPGDQWSGRPCTAGSTPVDQCIDSADQGFTSPDREHHLPLIRCTGVVKHATLTALVPVAGLHSALRLRAPGRLHERAVPPGLRDRVLEGQRRHAAQAPLRPRRLCEAPERMTAPGWLAGWLAGHVTLYFRLRV